VSHILVLGAGPIPSRSGAPASAAGARAWQFARALAEAGHRVDLLLAGGEPPGAARSVAPGGRPISVAALDPAEIDSADRLRRRLDRSPCDALVGASTYPSFLLARSGQPAPLWVDLHGDPMAEGQALARAIGSDEPVERYAWLLAWCLRRGDRFSAVSAAQRRAVLGQLGAAARLNRANAGLELVAAVPDACEAPASAPAPPRGGTFEVIFTGSFNTWVDGDTLGEAIELVLAAAPAVTFRICGGEVHGFVEEPWRRFVERLGRLPPVLARRVAVSGWVEDGELERLESAAGCGVVPELQLVERELGSQNRSLRWMARGRPVVSTAQSELGQAIAERRLGAIYPPGDARALADRIVELAGDRDLADELGRNARAWVLAERSIEVTSRPLVEWASRPAHAPDRLDGSLPRLARRQAEMLRDQLHLESAASPDPPR
jgi:glycosyltransferase involved in cell wall biosynthesis